MFMSWRRQLVNVISRTAPLNNDQCLIFRHLEYHLDLANHWQVNQLDSHCEQPIYHGSVFGSSHLYMNIEGA